MRILLAHHFPLAGNESGIWTTAAADALGAAGHDVRLLTADDDRSGPPRADESRVVFGAVAPFASLTFPLPTFAGPHSFTRLSDTELFALRSLLRRCLDRQVDRFNPHLIHVHHAWVLGELAMESGVPYVVSVWGPELAAAEADPRYRPLVEQALENAGRVLLRDAAQREQVAARFGIDSQRLCVLSEQTPVTAGELVPHYHATLVERFGGLPDDA